ncbi:Mariner Mos1 transposase [Acromyrmex echinatior]|uniref:Mariner Mos1 transposase n=1 Tax=Acromyrmex echinatior TaxID=103372 RepID=F4WMV6_ACREC|nr:Mariner Mos1 transposase [Acromyrmex echinatior]
MQKRPSIASNHRKVILLHDNARPHVAIIVKQTLMDLEWEVLPHPAYSPDLASSDYHLMFRSMQHALEDTHFHNYSEVENWIAEWIDSKDRLFFRRGIQLLPEKGQKVIASEGKYFD